MKDAVYYLVLSSDLQSKASALEKAGGIVSTANGYDMQCTHCITSKVSRSEKFLGALASGAWLLKPSYIDAVVKAGSISKVKEADFEWRIDNLTSQDRAQIGELSDDTKRLLTATRAWRQHCSAGAKSARGQRTGAFQGWMVLLCMAASASREGLKRVLEAGHAVVSLHAKMPTSLKVRCPHALHSSHRPDIPLSLNAVLLPFSDADSCSVQGYSHVFIPQEAEKRLAKWKELAEANGLSPTAVGFTDGIAEYLLSKFYSN